jgi:bacteriocin-like protein
MKTRKENSANLENKSFNVLKKDELMQIKGGYNEPIGEPIQEDGDFD